MSKDGAKGGAKVCRMCEARTINLARTNSLCKPDMDVYDKCAKPCVKTCPTPSAPLSPSCIKVLSKEEEYLDKCGRRRPVPKTPRNHGKFFWLVKIGTILGAMYITHREGVWGDQETTDETLKRWGEYSKSYFTKEPPKFDCNGNVVQTCSRGQPTLGSEVFRLYKSVITTCFEGTVMLPRIAYCSYKSIAKERELRRQEEIERLREEKEKKAKL